MVSTREDRPQPNTTFSPSDTWSTKLRTKHENCDTCYCNLIPDDQNDERMTDHDDE